MHSRFAAFGSREQHNTQHFNGGMYTAAGASGAIGLLEPGAVIVVGSTVGITLEGVLTAAVFRLMMAGGSTETGASRAMLELKLLEDTVPDGVCVVGCVVDGVCDDWLGLKRLYDCTPKLGLETSALVVKLEQLENTVLDGALLELRVVDGVGGAIWVGSAAEGTLEPGAVTARGSTRTVVLRG